MKRLIIPTLFMSSIVMAKSTYHPLKSKLLNPSNSITVNLNSIDIDTYKIKSGDDIDSIASRYHISVKKLKKINNIKSKKSLTVGRTIKIPDQTIKLSTLLSNIQDIEDIPNFPNISPMLKEAKEHLGKSYVWGAVGPAKFDCSGFTAYVCRKNGITIPRTSIMQGEVGVKVDKKELQEGDLIFFDTSKEKKGYITHVGIYLGDNKFIHASSANKQVVISSLNQSFYKARFKWGRRVNKLLASK